MRHTADSAANCATPRARASGRLRLLVPAIGLVVALGGCGTVNQGVSQALGSAPAIGLPAGAPERPTGADRQAFPAVHDMPPQRTTAVLTAQEQRQMEKELVAARDGQRNSGVVEAPAAPALAPVSRSPKPVIEPRPAAPRGTGPGSSGQSIY